MIPPIRLGDDEREALAQLFASFDSPGSAILVDGKVVPCMHGEALLWIIEHEEDCQIAKDLVGDYEVSTVFLTVNASGKDDKPLHFETMLFHPDKSCVFDRYETMEEALNGHKRACLQAFAMSEKESEHDV